MPGSVSAAFCWAWTWPPVESTFESIRHIELALSIKLAQQFQGEIVSADSRLFYRGMDVGTAKPTIPERKGIPHHLLDVAAPDELKVIFIEYVHRHLARYGCDVKRDRRYVCAACATPVTDLTAVRKRFAAGKDFITCQTHENAITNFNISVGVTDAFMRAVMQEILGNF